MAFKVVIPARFGSTRLPGKPLLDLGGRPMIQWVIEAAAASGADEVLVATDDETGGAIRSQARDSTDHPLSIDLHPWQRAASEWSAASGRATRQQSRRACCNESAAVKQHDATLAALRVSLQLSPPSAGRW